MTVIEISKDKFEDVSGVTIDVRPVFVNKASDGAIYSVVFTYNDNSDKGSIGIVSGKYNGLNRISILTQLGRWYCKNLADQIKAGEVELEYSWSDAKDFFENKRDLVLKIIQKMPS